MNNYNFIEWGEYVVAWILKLAALVTGEGLPGIVSLVLILFLVILMVWYIWITWRFLGAVAFIREHVLKDGEQITGNRLIDLDRAFRDLEGKRGPRKRLGAAWKEFRETTVDPEEETYRLRNTTRPEVFFSREEMGLERGIWRQIPALFVSVGLFLTFLGLVAALAQTGEILNTSSTDSSTAATEGLQTLLQIASAKFVMSLTGLLCSIIFTIVLRLSAGRIDHSLHGLCIHIERGCHFLSEQKLLDEVIEQAKEQTEHLKTFSTELVAQVARPLKEELQNLPNAFKDSIQEVMSEALQTITNRVDSGVGDMVTNVSTQITGEVQEAANSMVQAMEGVRENIEAVAGRLDQTATAMIDGVGNAIQNITTNAGELADATGQTIRSAGDDMAAVITNASDTMREQLLDPMATLTATINDFSAKIEEITEGARAYAEVIGEGANTVRLANQQLGQSARTLTTAINPIQEVVERIESSTQAIGQTVGHTQAIMDSVRQSIEASQEVFQTSLHSLSEAVEQFQSVIENLSGIDAELGKAFERIASSVRDRIKQIEDFNKQLNEDVSKALTRLQTVIEQAEPFVPQNS